MGVVFEQLGRKFGVRQQVVLLQIMLEPGKCISAIDHQDVVSPEKGRALPSHGRCCVDQPPCGSPR